jgi:hypothetical protein
LKRVASLAAVATRRLCCLRLRRDVGRRPVAQRGAGAGRAVAVIRLVPGRAHMRTRAEVERGDAGAGERSATTTRGERTVSCGGAGSDAQRPAVCAQRPSGAAADDRRAPTRTRNMHATRHNNCKRWAHAARTPPNAALRVGLTRSALPLPPLLPLSVCSSRSPMRFCASV